MNGSPQEGRSKLESAISLLLILGVVTSLFLEALGITLYDYTSGQLNISEAPRFFIHGQNFFGFLHSLLVQGNAPTLSIYLMALGIAFLMLTPYVRVIVSVFYFAREKDLKFTFITLWVLVLLTLSLAIR